MKGIRDLLKAAEYFEIIKDPKDRTSSPNTKNSHINHQQIEKPQTNQQNLIQTISNQDKKNTKVIPKKKQVEKSDVSRIAHNQSEKLRRENMRKLLKNVQDLLPISIKNERMSTTKILTTCQDYILNAGVRLRRESIYLHNLNHERLILTEQLKSIIGENERRHKYNRALIENEIDQEPELIKNLPECIDITAYSQSTSQRTTSFSSNAIIVEECNETIKSSINV